MWQIDIVLLFKPNSLGYIFFSPHFLSDFVFSLPVYLSACLSLSFLSLYILLSLLLRVSLSLTSICHPLCLLCSLSLPLFLFFTISPSLPPTLFLFYPLSLSCSWFLLPPCAQSLSLSLSCHVFSIHPTSCFSVSPPLNRCNWYSVIGRK